ncbi:MAG: hypothetical protein ABSC38_04560 [Verrucomicrobiia bacterium]
MSPVQSYAKRTIEYLEQDLVSYEAVLKDGSLHGKLGVGMITNATAALDLFGWLLYQTLDQKISNRDVFKKLIGDVRFFAADDFINERIFYGIVRCGVVHQFYPKDIAIVALDRDDPFVQSGGKAAVNAIGLYRRTVRGLKKVCEHILTLSGKDLDEMDFKLELRRRLDEEELDGAKLNIHTLPQA